MIHHGQGNLLKEPFNWGIAYIFSELDHDHHHGRQAWGWGSRWQLYIQICRRQTGRERNGGSAWSGLLKTQMPPAVAHLFQVWGLCQKAVTLLWTMDGAECTVLPTRWPSRKSCVNSDQWMHLEARTWKEIPGRSTWSWWERQRSGRNICGYFHMTKDDKT